MTLPSSGHTSNHVREAFREIVEEARDTVSIDERDVTAAELCGMLWNCTDTMPGGLCDELDLPLGSSYAQGARSLKPRLAA